MKISKVIDVLETRKDWLELKLKEWDGPLKTGSYAYLDRERIALEHAIALAIVELDQSHFDAAAARRDKAAEIKWAASVELPS
jgi:hypothetical protein